MRIARVFLTVVLLALFAAGAVAMMIETVPPSSIGVRQIQWGGGGIVEKDFPTGFHLGITGYHKWYFLDRRTHFLNFTAEGRYGNGQHVGPLEVRTKDNNLVNFDVSVTYRIIPGAAHQMVQRGVQEVYRERIVAVVEKELREQLAQLSSEDIYDTAMRMHVVDETMPILAKEMAEYFVEPESILVRAVSFPEEYERKLQAKQLTYQKKLLASAEKLVEDERAVTETLSAEIEAAEKELRGDWDKRLQQVASDNKVEIAKILAQAEVYDRTQRAESDAAYETLTAEGRLQVDKSEALRNELRNQALDTLGGRIYLAKQAADNLHFEHVTLNSNDPNVPSILDVNQLVRVLMGSEE